MAEAFDPASKLINLPRRQKQPDGGWKMVDNAYLETRWRLVWLHDVATITGASVSITTELLDHVFDKYAVFKAMVTVSRDGGQLVGTGHATKTAGGPISYLENAETHALGRALAAIGFGTQWAMELDEGVDEEGATTPVDAPVRAATPAAVKPVGQEPRPIREAPPPAAANGAPPAGGWQDRPATEPQIKAIYGIARGVQAMDDGTIEQWCFARFGAKPGHLSRRQASEAIDALKLAASS